MSDLTTPPSEPERVERTVDEDLAHELVERARSEGVELVGPGGLLTGLTKTVLETALEAELEDHLGYPKHAVEGSDKGNSRNGTRSKTVLTEVGEVEIEVPRDRDGSFDPRIVKMGPPGFHGDCFDWFPLFKLEGRSGPYSHGVLPFELGRGHACERGVEPFGVEPGDVLADRQLELGAGAPDAVADQLRLEAVDEALGGRVVERITDRADRGEHAMVVEGLAVVEGRVLFRLNRSSQRFVVDSIVNARSVLPPVSSSRVSCGVGR